MKTIIIEGLDRCGKNSLITGVCNHFEYDNISIRHCAKPPKNVDNIYQWQMRCFIKEGELSKNMKTMEDSEHKYYENILIYNRYYPGEYVYGILFRSYDKKFISHRLNEFEKQYIDLENANLITLYADPVFLMNNEDGNSLSQTVEQKTKEIELFKEYHERSLIKNKLLLKVDNEGKFLDKDYLLNTVLNFINEKK